MTTGTVQNTNSGHSSAQSASLTFVTVRIPTGITPLMQLYGRRALLQGSVAGESTEGLLANVFHAMLNAGKDEIEQNLRRAEAAMAQNIDSIPAPLAKHSLPTLPSLLQRHVPSHAAFERVLPFRWGTHPEATNFNSETVEEAEARREEQLWRAFREAEDEAVIRGNMVQKMRESGDGGNGSGATVILSLPSNPPELGIHNSTGLLPELSEPPSTFFTAARAFFRRAR